jgi:archaellum component FlaF (FlaF/FlaG flagellin family)
MGVPYIYSANGNQYTNINECRTYNLSLTTALSSLRNEICSEVILINKTGTSINVFDNGYSAASAALLLDNNESIVLRGITTTAQVSAKALSGSGVLYYRTQSYSNTPASL